MKKILYFALLLLGLLLLVSFFTKSRSNKANFTDMISFQGNTQGTYYSIKYFDPQGRNFQAEVETLLKNFDRCASLWDENSSISRVNKAKANELITVDTLFLDILNKSYYISELFPKAFDVSIGALSSAYGFGPKKGQAKELTEDDIKKALECCGLDKIKIQKNGIIKKLDGLQIDLNAIAQGYSVDRVADFLKMKNIKDFIIDIGGEVYANGKKSDHTFWRVGIEQPTVNEESERIIQNIVNLENEALATSGNYRKFYEKDGLRYSHTIDPTTGKGVTHNLLSASVVCKQTWQADAIATACMVMGMEKTKESLKKYPELEVFLIYSQKDHTFASWASPAFEKRLQSKKY